MNQGYSSGYNQKQTHTKSTLNNKINSKQTPINPSEQLNIQWRTQIRPQQQHTFIRPTIPQPTRLETSRGFPLFNCKNYTFNNFKFIFNNV